MKYTNCFKDEKISKLGMGAMRLPVKDDEKGKPIDFEKARGIIRRCRETGITYFDTAYIYHGGKSEAFLADALAEYPRESYYLADKFNLQANPDFRTQFAEQLLRLKTDYIDFYLLHGVQDDSIDEMLNCGCIKYFREMQKHGAIRRFGFSFHGSPEGFKKMLDAEKWDFVQLQLNLFDWQYGDIKQMYDMADKRGLPIIVMEPLRGGRLARLSEASAAPLIAKSPERSIASWFMRWLIGLPRVAVVLSGMNDENQVTDNAAIFDKSEPLSAEDTALAAAALEKYRNEVAVACTACRYCCDSCPAGLEIPRLLNLYNDIKLDSAWRASLLRNFPEDKRPDACVACGACTAHCPQSIDVPKYMAEMVELMEKMRK